MRKLFYKILETFRIPFHLIKRLLHLVQRLLDIQQHQLVIQYILHLVIILLRPYYYLSNYN